MILRVQSDDDALIQEILDRVKPLGVEVVVDDGDPLEETLFIASRAAKKLDNLGQLRHLHKIEQYLNDIRYSLVSIAANTNPLRLETPSEPEH